MSSHEEDPEIPFLIPTTGTEDSSKLLRVGKLFNEKLYNRSNQEADQSSPHEWTAEVKFSRTLTEKELQTAFTPIILQNLQRNDQGFPALVHIYGINSDHDMDLLLESLSLEDLQPSTPKNNTNNSGNVKEATKKRKKPANKKKKPNRFVRVVLIVKVVSVGSHFDESMSEEEEDEDNNNNTKENQEEKDVQVSCISLIYW